LFRDNVLPCPPGALAQDPAARHNGTDEGETVSGRASDEGSSATGAAHDDGPGRLSVGRLAGDVGLTAQALRHYDRLGILRPAGVDPDTGYRWYAADQVPRARLIARLRGAGMPLDAVRTWLGAHDDPAVAKRLLDEHRRRLEARLTRVRGDLHRLAHVRNTERDAAEGATSGGVPELPDVAPTEGTHPLPDERRLAADLFNGVWRLMETEERTPAQDDRMVHMAHASRHHWEQVGTAANLARGEWQCSRVYAVLGRAEPCLHHARRVLELCQEHGIGDWDLAFAHEALARAHAVAGDEATARAALAEARNAAQNIADPADRELLESDLATVEALLAAP
jgi:DNA-binding transcriptional MerR regulator